jgi:hypothetical protein
MEDKVSGDDQQGASAAKILDFALAGNAFLAGKDEPQEWLIDGLFPHPSAQAHSEDSAWRGSAPAS